MKSKTYKDELYCDVCDKDTQQEVFESGHERDSSGDWQRCLECGAYRYGLSGSWDKYEEEPEKE